jgi:cell division initiation protein
MEVTPQELRGSEVKEAFRGYHRDEVDMLLERAAATIEDLTDQLQNGPRPRALPASLVNRNDAETIQRTLILAQRAADNAMAEAEETARVLVEESESKAKTLVSDAEASARRIHDEETRQHEAEIAALLARRDRLQADADALETYANEYRDRVWAAIESDLAKLGVMIDAPSPRPELHDVDSGTPGYSTTSR